MIRRRGAWAVWRGMRDCFRPADDLAKFAQALLNGGGGILSAASVEKMTSPGAASVGSGAARIWLGHRFSVLVESRRPAARSGPFGHTGFTGTSVWIDPTTQSYIILLTNAVHPRGKGNAIGLRSKVATEVAAALALTIHRERSFAVEEHYRL